ncbi:MAG: hypothetical protein EBE86_003415 [Hormoscilla sp. GUM202]|nr:hypothetical protein [Hormoscilla sp. GUM202]
MASNGKSNNDISGISAPSRKIENATSPHLLGQTSHHITTCLSLPKWLLSAERSQYCFSAGQARMVTHIGDLQSDLYEEFATIPDTQNHLLVSSRQNRRLLGQEVSLYNI